MGVRSWCVLCQPGACDVTGVDGRPVEMRVGVHGGSHLGRVFWWRINVFKLLLIKYTVFVKYFLVGSLHIPEGNIQDIDIVLINWQPLVLNIKFVENQLLLTFNDFRSQIIFFVTYRLSFFKVAKLLEERIYKYPCILASSLYCKKIEPKITSVWLIDW